MNIDISSHLDHAPTEHRSKQANSSPGLKTLLDHALLQYIYHSEARNLRLTDRQTDSVEAFYQSFPSAQLSPRKDKNGEKNWI